MNKAVQMVFVLGVVAALASAGTVVANAQSDQTPIPVQPAPTSPYGHVPIPGNHVSFDGTVGGQKTAWAYYSQFWLEHYLSVTVDAAEFAIQGSDLDNELGRIANHVITFPNGTHATVDSIVPYKYKDRLDLEVRVNISDGSLRGRDVWTTAAELVDGAGHPYVKI